MENCVYLCPDGDGIIKKKRKKATIADIINYIENLIFAQSIQIQTAMID